MRTENLQTLLEQLLVEGDVEVSQWVSESQVSTAMSQLFDLEIPSQHHDISYTQ